MKKIKFLTKTNADGKTEAAGKTYILPDEKADYYIKQGLAVAEQMTDDEVKATTDSEKKAAKKEPPEA